jgi:hypothetical protein
MGDTARRQNTFFHDAALPNSFFVHLEGSINDGAPGVRRVAHQSYLKQYPGYSQLCTPDERCDCSCFSNPHRAPAANLGRTHML